MTQLLFAQLFDQPYQRRIYGQVFFAPRRGFQGIDELVSAGDPLPPFDVHAPLLSLPGLLGTTLETIPNQVPYLTVDPERVEQFVSKIVRELEGLGESDISSETIGEMVMEHLRELDDVAYVRFASVYRNFREPKDFEDAIAELSGEDDGKASAAPRK